MISEIILSNQSHIDEQKNMNVKMNISLGEFFPSSGNIYSISKNIQKQFSKRMNGKSIEDIYDLEAIIPKVYQTNTEQAINEVLPLIFPTAIKRYIYTKELNPDKFFIKITFQNEELQSSILDLGIFSISTGSFTNIKKNIIKQFQNRLTKKLEIYSLDIFESIQFIVPIHLNNTEYALREALYECAPDNIGIYLSEFDSEEINLEKIKVKITLK